MTEDERYAQQLRERYVAPTIDVDPDVVVRRGRRRRLGLRVAAGVAVAVVAVAAGATLSGAHLPGRPVAPAGPSQPAGAPPAEPTDGDAFVWIGPDRVPPGADLAVALVSRTGADLIGGVGMTVERWDGASWQAYGFAGLCVDGWRCAGSVTRDGDGGVLDIGIGPGTAMRLSTNGLERGWYRLSEGVTDMSATPAPDGSRPGGAVAGQFEVTDDAPQPAPLPPTDGVATSVHPALLAQPGGAVTLSPVVPPNADGSQTSDDIAAAVAGLSETARVERWTDGAWLRVGEVDLTPAPGDGTARAANVPALPEGAYRLVRTGPPGEVTGSFWVVDPGPRYVLFRPDEPVPAHVSAEMDRVASSRADPRAPDELRSTTPASCGTWVLDQGVDSSPVPWACLTNGAAGGAQLVLVRPTTEGDPIVTYYRSGPGIDGVRVFTDRSSDSFGSQGWLVQTCTASDREPLCG